MAFCSSGVSRLKSAERPPGVVLPSCWAATAAAAEIGVSWPPGVRPDRMPLSAKLLCLRDDTSDENAPGDCAPGVPAFHPGNPAGVPPFCGFCRKIAGDRGPVSNPEMPAEGVLVPDPLWAISESGGRIRLPPGVNTLARGVSLGDLWGLLSIDAFRECESRGAPWRFLSSSGAANDCSNGLGSRSKVVLRVPTESCEDTDVFRAVGEVESALDMV